jgi:hypothetical protein
MNLKHLLKKLTADARFERTGHGTALRISNFKKDDRVDYVSPYNPYNPLSVCEILYIGSCYLYNDYGIRIIKEIESWLKQHADGKYRIDKCHNSLVIHFSRDADAVMYKLIGPYA